jgi:hypothetical protein
MRMALSMGLVRAVFLFSVAALNAYSVIGSQATMMLHRWAPERTRSGTKMIDNDGVRSRNTQFVFQNHTVKSLDESITQHASFPNREAQGDETSWSAHEVACQEPPAESNCAHQKPFMFLNSEVTCSDEAHDHSCDAFDHFVDKRFDSPDRLSGKYDSERNAVQEKHS